MSAAKSVVRGDTAKAAAQAGFVARSAAQDTRAALSSRIAMAKARLGR